MADKEDAKPAPTKETEPVPDETVSVSIGDDALSDEGSPPPPPQSVQPVDAGPKEGDEKVTREEAEEAAQDYSEAVKRRIAKLTGKLREAERQKAAAVEYAQAAKRDAEEAYRRSNVIDTSYLGEFKARLDAQEKYYKHQLAVAINAGDVNAQVEAQASLSKLAVDRNRVEAAEAQRPRQEAEPEQRRQEQQQREAPPPRPDPKAEAWASKNEWFGSDQPMTLTAFSIHKTLTEEEGMDPTSDEYYEEIDRRIRADFPHKFQQKQAPTARQQSPVAPANRSVSVAAGKKEIRLSPSQVAIAKQLGVSLESYARQVAKLDMEKQRG